MPEENVVEVVGKDGQLARILFDPKTGMPAGTIQDTPQGNLQEHWSDFQPEAGIQFPRKITILRNGGPFATVTVSSVKVNQGATVQSLSRRPAR
jgi:hypothetical protein